MTATTGRFSAEAEEWIDNLNRVIDELATERDRLQEAMERSRRALRRIANSPDASSVKSDVAREALVGLPE